MHNINIYGGQRPLFALVQQFQLHLRSAVFPTQNKRDICQIHYISGCTTLYNVQISKCLANSRAIFADFMTLMMTSSFICLGSQSMLLLVNADVMPETWELCYSFDLLSSPIKQTLSDRSWLWTKSSLRHFSGTGSFFGQCKLPSMHCKLQFAICIGKMKKRISILS